jgi:hypothetical protein
MNELEFFPDEFEDYPFGGFTYMGGKVVLGPNANDIDEWCDIHGKLLDPELALGATMLASVGYTSVRIERKLIELDESYSARVINLALQGIEKTLHISGRHSRHRILPTLAAAEIFRIDQLGSGFHISEYRRAQFGLLLRGALREDVSEASGCTLLALNKVITDTAHSWHVRRSPGLFAAAIMNQLIDATSCVPLVRTRQRPYRIHPMIPSADWEDLIAADDIDEFRKFLRYASTLSHG